MRWLIFALGALWFCGWYALFLFGGYEVEDMALGVVIGTLFVAALRAAEQALWVRRSAP